MRQPALLGGQVFMRNNLLNSHLTVLPGMLLEASEHAQDGFDDASSNGVDDHGKNRRGIDNPASGDNDIGEDALKRGDEGSRPPIDEASELCGGVCTEEEQHNPDKQHQLDDTECKGDDLGDPVQGAGSGV